MTDIVEISEVWETFQEFYVTDVFSYIVQGVLIYVAALWIAVIIWVARDSIHRSNSIVFQIITICLNIFLPIFGLILYLIIRPSKTLSEKYYEDLELKMLEEAGITFCNFCNEEIEKEFLFCPTCTKQVKKKCSKCHKPYILDWELCPYCGTSSKSKVKAKSKTKKELSKKEKEK